MGENHIHNAKTYFELEEQRFEYDYITHIDGETVVGLSLNEAVSKLRGKVGTKVQLSIRRINSKPIELTIKRQEIIICKIFIGTSLK